MVRYNTALYILAMGLLPAYITGAAQAASSSSLLYTTDYGWQASSSSLSRADWERWGESNGVLCGVSHDRIELNKQLAADGHYNLQQARTNEIVDYSKPPEVTEIPEVPSYYGCRIRENSTSFAWQESRHLYWLLWDRQKKKIIRDDINKLPADYFFLKRTETEGIHLAADGEKTQLISEYNGNIMQTLDKPIDKHLSCKISDGSLLSYDSNKKILTLLTFPRLSEDEQRKLKAVAALLADPSRRF